MGVQVIPIPTEVVSHSLPFPFPIPCFSPIPMGFPLDSHSHWESHSHAHLYTRLLDPRATWHADQSLVAARQQSLLWRVTTQKTIIIQ